MRAGVVLLGSILLTHSISCSSSDDCDTANSSCLATGTDETYTGDVSLDALSWSCCNASGGSCEDGPLFWYDLFLTGHTTETVLHIARSQTTWSETHSIPVVDQDAEGFWENRYLVLEVLDTSSCSNLTDCQDAFESASNTLFNCGISSQDRLTWAVEFYTSTSGDDPASCVTWGADPTQFDSCTVVEPNP